MRWRRAMLSTSPQTRLFALETNAGTLNGWGFIFVSVLSPGELKTGFHRFGRHVASRLSGLKPHLRATNLIPTPPRFAVLSCIEPHRSRRCMASNTLALHGRFSFFIRCAECYLPDGAIGNSTEVKSRVEPLKMSGKSCGTTSRGNAFKTATSGGQSKAAEDWMPKSCVSRRRGAPCGSWACFRCPRLSGEQ